MELREHEKNHIIAGIVASIVVLIIFIFFRSELNYIFRYIFTVIQFV